MGPRRGGGFGSTRHGTDRGGFGARGRGRGRGGNRGRSTGRPKYNASRLQEVGSDDESTSQHEYPASNDLEDQGSDGQSSSSDEENEDIETGSYAALLQSLNANFHSEGRMNKKRKLDTADSLSRKGEQNGKPKLSSNKEFQVVSRLSKETVEEHVEGTSDEEVDEIDDAEQNDHGSESGPSEAEEDLTDPFDRHFCGPEVAANIAAVQERIQKVQTSQTSEGVKKTVIGFDSRHQQKGDHVRMKPSHLKSKLFKAGDELWKQLNNTEKDLACSILRYGDTIYAGRSVENAGKLRELSCLHALNHVLKTRDRVLKNNARIARDTTEEPPELRDQGFTRPKVLIILPTKQSCVRYIETLATLLEPEQQENKGRFQNNFANPEDMKELDDDKPADFRELFSGNDDDMFRIGLKITRKTLKYFSQFYTSDIILASPLGLRNAIESSGKDKKSHDADFLSSIEIAIVDHADALLMQNWAHVEYIFSQLNALPRDSHGCDFTRVRNIYLDNQSHYVRQTAIFTSFLTPEINSLSSHHLHNHSGLVKYCPIYPGAILSLPPALSLTFTTSMPQTFLRFSCPTPTSDPSLRFTYFTSTVLPSLLPRPNSSTPAPSGTLIFTPSYFFHLRLQTHFSTDPSCTPLSFASITEYTSHRDAARTRSHFSNGRYAVLLYTERAHHFRRFRSMRGVKRIIFFGLPENSAFWPEICGFLAGSGDGGGKIPSGPSSRKAERDGKGRIKALFSKWDVLKLERIVGSERVGRMVRGEGDAGGDSGDIFEFV